MDLLKNFDLNIFFDQKDLLKRINSENIITFKSKKFSSLPIITPHEGEAAKLLGINVDEISNKREYYAQKISDKFSVITVLKGYETIITDGNKIYICKDGDSSLAFAGSGDILAGLIGSFLAKLIYLLSDEGLSSLTFSKNEIKRCKCLRFWVQKINNQGLDNLSENERFQLHLDLEEDLPSFILEIITCVISNIGIKNNKNINKIGK